MFPPGGNDNSHTIKLGLPAGWAPQTIGESGAGYNTFVGTNESPTPTVTGNTHSWTTVHRTSNPNTTAHITVEARFARRSDGAAPYVTGETTPTSTVRVAITSGTATANAEVDVTIPTLPSANNPAPMLKGDKITVTFHKVQVRNLRSLELDESGTIRDKVLVGDEIPGSDYDVSIMVEPPMPSKVTVKPTSVDAGDIEDVAVTYTVQEDKLFGANNIFIELPTDWAAAYRSSASASSETTTSFGPKVLAKAPSSSSDRAKTSYVVLTYKFKSTGTEITDHNPKATTPTFLDIEVSKYNAYVAIEVTGGMTKGDTITVTFNNVMIQALEAREPMDVPLIVTDDIPASDYTSDVTIQVIPPKLGNVRVTPDTVTAESMVDLTVRYTATNTLADDDTYGRIRVELPAGWGPSDSSDIIHLKRQVGDPDATYVTLGKSSGVKLAKITGNPDGLRTPRLTQDTWWMDIDVDKMTARQQVTLTVHNLMISELTAERKDRHEDITASTDKVQVRVILKHVHICCRKRLPHPLAKNVHP